jgi:starvation-inducible DNA-binding protein
VRTSHELFRIEALIRTDLQEVLVTLIDLSLTGKHARWNVAGPDVRSIRLYLDEMVDVWRAAADAVGERISVLGYFPDGRAQTVSGRRELATLPEGPLAGRTVALLLETLLSDAVRIVRAKANRIGAIDAITADLFHSIVGTLEQQRRLMRAPAS